MTPHWKRIWRPLLIPMVMLMALGIVWHRLKILHELLPSPAVRARLEKLCETHSLPYPLPNPRLVVHKSRRSLDLYSGDNHIKTYRIALGRNPVGHKTLADDGKTPEGHYRVCEKISRAKHHRYLGLSYPNTADAIQGFNEGRIPLREREEILALNRALQQPARKHVGCPPRTALGSGIGLHGGGTRSDWTNGSIALADRDVEEIFYLLPIRAPVQILP